MLKAGELAAKLHCGIITVYRLARQGQIPASRIGGEWRFDPKEIERWIEQRTVPVNK